MEKNLKDWERMLKTEKDWDGLEVFLEGLCRIRKYREELVNFIYQQKEHALCVRVAFIYLLPSREVLPSLSSGCTIRKRKLP